MAAQDAEIIQQQRSPAVARGGASDPVQLQPSGFLIELSLDWIVQRASENIDQLLGTSHVTLIDEPLSRFVQAQALHDLRNHFARLSGSTGIAKAYRVRLTDDRPRCDIAFQLCGGRVLLEAVRSPERGLGESIGAVGGLIDGMAELSGQALLDGAARRMRALTGCDGCVIALDGRSANSDRGGFSLGNPADIGEVPPIVADSAAAAVQIFPRKGSDSTLASALLKAPSAAAVQSLRDKGIGSLLSVPIRWQGKSLGLIQCGWREQAREPNFELHGAAELFGQMFALRLEIDRLRDR